MALEVGKLVVELEARVSKLESGLKRGNRAVDNFASRTNKRLKSVGKSFARLAKRFVGIGALIGAAAGAFSFVALIRGSIDAAGAVEGFRLRLLNLIGSSEQSGKAIQSLTKFAQEVSPSLRDIIEAAATLGTTALGSSDKILTLTKTAANISAVTGLTLNQSAQNLQRTLSQGIGAADLFRERGVRSVVEALTGVPNLIAQPLSVVAQAMEDVFGPNGVFGKSAEQFKSTLPGAISVTGDALFQFQDALGSALSPTIIATLTERIIPFFGVLTEKIKANEVAIGEFARVGIILLVKAFNKLIRAGIGVTRFFINFSGAFREVKLSVAEFIFSVLELFARIPTSIPVIGLIGSSAQKALGGVATTLQELRDDQDAAAESASGLNAGFDAIIATTKDLDTEINKLGKDTVATTAKAAAAAIAQAEANASLFAAAKVTVGPAVEGSTNSAFKRQLGLIDRISVATQKSINPLQGQLLQLQQQNVLLLANEVAARGIVADIENQLKIHKESGAEAKDQAFVQRRTGFITAQLAQEQAKFDELKLKRKKASAQLDAAEVKNLERQALLNARIVTAANQLGPALNELKKVNAEVALEIQEKLGRALQDAGQDTSKIADALQSALDKVNGKLEKEAVNFGETIGGVLAENVGDVFSNLLRGEAVSFSAFLADTSADLLEGAMETVLTGLGEQLNELFEGLGEGGSSLGAGIAAGIGVGLSILSRVLEDETAKVTNNLVGSAVDAAQALRGVIAGPSDIPIFQVQQSISESFVETNSILRDILVAINRSGATGTTSATAVDIDPAAILESAALDLDTGSTALA